jgi:hypothetical protein
LINAEIVADLFVLRSDPLDELEIIGLVHRRRSDSFRPLAWMGCCGNSCLLDGLRGGLRDAGRRQGDHCRRRSTASAFGLADAETDRRLAMEAPVTVTACLGKPQPLKVKADMTAVAELPHLCIRAAEAKAAEDARPPQKRRPPRTHLPQHQIVAGRGCRDAEGPTSARLRQLSQVR